MPEQQPINREQLLLRMVNIMKTNSHGKSYFYMLAEVIAQVLHEDGHPDLCTELQDAIAAVIIEDI